MPVVSLPDTEWIEMVGPVAGIEAVPWDIVAGRPAGDELELVVPPYIGDRAPAQATWRCCPRCARCSC